MRFEQPEYFNLIWIVAFVLFMAFWGNQRRKRRATSFVADPLLPKLAGQQTFQKYQNRVIWLSLALVFMVTALAQPRWGFEWEDLRQEGADLIVALDVSNSMLSEDIKPNRLERAKFKVADLLRMLEGDRIGLVAFAGTSFLQCPLTLDYQAAEMFLKAMETDLIPIQGTAIGHAINTSIRAFSQMEKKSRALILITDGEDHEGKVVSAIQHAQEEGVRIFVIGIGGDTAVPVPRKPGQQSLKKDSEGNVVLSRINEPLLQKIAEDTGGTYIRSVTGDLDLKTIYLDNIKQRVDRRELKSTRRKRWQDRFQWFILLALACLIAEKAIREKKNQAT